MSAYVFITDWEFQAPVEAVWDEIRHSERWPEWWPAVREVTELRKGDAQGVGSVRRYTWRGALPYSLTFDMETTRVDTHVRLEGIASGELSGRGCWTFRAEGPTSTHVRYDWEVDATRLWMRLLAPVARPAFAWNHDHVMSGGFDALTARLARRLKG